MDSRRGFRLFGFPVDVRPGFIMLLVLFAILLIPVSAIIRGLVLCKLWAWFIMPQFHLEPMRIPFALGLALIVGFLTHQNVDCEPQKASATAKFVGVVAQSIFLPLAVLVFGWIYTLFI